MCVLGLFCADPAKSVDRYRRMGHGGKVMILLFSLATEGYKDVDVVADGPIVGILDGPVGLDMADNAIRCILNSAVGLDMSYGLVIGVGHALGIGLAAEQRAQEHEEYEEDAFHSVEISSLTYFSRHLRLWANHSWR